MTSHKEAQKIAIESGEQTAAVATALVPFRGPRFVEVAVPVHVAQTFTYRLTPEQSIHAKPGARIMVPFGRKMRTGYIVALHDELPSDIQLDESEIKEAERLVDEVPVSTPEIMQLAKWVAEYYASPLGEVIKATLPPGINPRPQTARSSVVKAKLRRFVRLTSATPEKITEKQQQVLSTLQQRGPLPLKELSAAIVSSLVKKGLVEIFDEAVRRDPLANSVSFPVEDYTLTAAQSSVLEKIREQVDTETYGAFLLHGVTGSGKTEIYIRAMRAALERGRSAMMLVPEIALTPVFSQRLRSHFGDRVAIFHSSLQRGERFDEWTRVKNGDARVVIGTRSAVFAPVQNLGLIVVDEEHESSYRQQESPYYNARDTAIVRAQKESATVVLGSATPSLESFHNARGGKYRLLTLPERIAARPMATARIVDMRNVFVRHGKPRVFSDELLEAIQETYERREQSIILLNRRGYSSFVLCRSC
ncbi:MAG TPA: primosomal protein N', partial [Pyrinomonadaceae bacterium]|nr:primosomal protein N' [Pyrinomonadaceae bacterium]